MSLAKSNTALAKENESLRKALADSDEAQKTCAANAVELASSPAVSTQTSVSVAVTAVLVGGSAFALGKKFNSRKAGVDASLIA